MVKVKSSNHPDQAVGALGTARGYEQGVREQFSIVESPTFKVVWVETRLRDRGNRIIAGSDMTEAKSTRGRMQQKGKDKKHIKEGFGG